MSREFASRDDLAEKQTSFTELAPGAWAYTAQGDPNAGVVIGEDGVLVVDALATPVQARRLIAEIRKLTELPVKYLVLSHYHAVRVLGASAYGGCEIISSRGTYELIEERGQQDFESEAERFPRLFQAVESIPGLTRPTLVFEGALTLWLGGREVRVLHLGAGHTKGDTVVWLPGDRVLFSGDLVEMGATPYCGDAQLELWPASLARLEALGPRALVPGRGEARAGERACLEAIDSTRRFVTDLFEGARRGVGTGQSLGELYRELYPVMAERYGDWVIFEHCMPFNVSRAYDEASGIGHPRIWTRERDLEMWRALEQGEGAR